MLLNVLNVIIKLHCIRMGVRLQIATCPWTNDLSVEKCRLLCLVTNRFDGGRRARWFRFEIRIFVYFFPFFVWAFYSVQIVVRFILNCDLNTYRDLWILLHDSQTIWVLKWLILFGLNQKCDQVIWICQHTKIRTLNEYNNLLSIEYRKYGPKWLSPKPDKRLYYSHSECTWCVIL